MYASRTGQPPSHPSLTARDSTDLSGKPPASRRSDRKLMSTLPSAFPRLPVARALSSPLSSTHNTFPSITSRDTTTPATDPSPVLPLFLFGLLAAFGTACLVCKVPAAFMSSWTAFFLRTFAFVIGVVAAGIAGTQILWLLLSEKPVLNFRALTLTFAASWAFLPSIVFFYREHSLYLLIATSIATAITAVSLKRLVANATDVAFESTIPTPTNLNAPPDFSGLPITSRHSLWWIVATSIAAQLSILLWLLNHIPLACLLLAIPSFVLAWQATTSTAAEPASRTRRLRPYTLYVLSLLFTAIALLPWLNLPLAIQLTHLLGRTGIRTQNFHPYHLADATDYTSIVLWPNLPKKKTKILDIPTHHSLAPGSTEVTKPLVIPFDGPYWYFQPPDTRPSPRAFVMHGKSTAVNMHSTNDFPLQMEAHQTLATPINLDCCRAIDLDLTNADNRPGTIDVRLILADSRSPGHPSLALSAQPILSSQAAHFSLVRAPINETLHFQIPPSRLHRFNEITVVFLTSRERNLGGAKVALKQFTLIPR